MSDAKTIAALQRNLADAEVERLRLVEQVKELEAESECQVDGIAPCSGAGKTEADWCRMCLVAEYRKARADVKRLEEIDKALWDGTHDAYCAGGCGRLTANGFCRDCMVHGGVDAYDRLALAEGFLATKDSAIDLAAARLANVLDMMRGWGERPTSDLWKRINETHRLLIGEEEP